MCEQRPEPVGAIDRPDEQHRGHDEHERRRPVLDRAEQVHPAEDDVDVEAPENREREPLGRRVAGDAGTEQRLPAGHDRRQHGVHRLAANPRLDAEPAARDQRPHQCRDVGAERAVGRPGEDRERNAVLRSRMRVQQDRDEHDGVAEDNGEERLLPVHARCHQPGGEHVRGNAVRHADPQRGVVVGGPVTAVDRNRRKVVVVERAGGNPRRVAELHAPVFVLDLRGHRH